MPLYQYKCPKCSKGREVFKSIAAIDRSEVCTCGSEMERRLSAPRVLGDYEPYDCPITGKRIEGRKAHRENLARHGCRVFEPGEREAAARFRKAQEEAFERDIGETVEAEIHAMPVAKREQLAVELQNGIDLTVTRN